MSHIASVSIEKGRRYVKEYFCEAQACAPKRMEGQPSGNKQVVQVKMEHCPFFPVQP